MKNIYESPVVEVIVLDTRDVITASDEYELPIVPAPTNYVW